MDLAKTRHKFELRLDSLIQTQSVIIQKFKCNDWLGNFSEEELPLAYSLISNFIFISEANTDMLLGQALKNLSTLLPNPADYSQWSSFVGNLYFAPVRENNADFSNSGNLFVGKVKKILTIEESRIVGTYEDIVNLAASGKNVVILDDFVGTGTQFIEFIDKLKSHSEFNRASRNLIYCPILCSVRGLNNINRNCDSIKFHPLHLMSERYSVQSVNSVFWPGRSPNWITEKVDEILRISKRIGIPDEIALGYKDMGMCIAFQHHVPDATLPIFTWNKCGWVPLVGAS